MTQISLKGKAGLTLSLPSTKFILLGIHKFVFKVIPLLIWPRLTDLDILRHGDN